MKKLFPKCIHHTITNLVTDFKLNIQISTKDISYMVTFFITLWATMLVPGFWGGGGYSVSIFKVTNMQAVIYSEKSGQGNQTT